ncbi:nucleotide sugar dehydrogenase [Ammoniphilus sp. YIM 78166]|uniref:nucleotide sugar dehydrogenase n=1 Tax=Ammoniphilus sp. YIM 78166 TaxID=1644106 RepID=UPI00106F6421|nr:nucleotide sugar dehydrogenase [Ammoniphilus sp. YIM 78166]
MNCIPQHFRDRTICIVGLGYVGLTLAVAMANKGFNIIGVEISSIIRDRLLQKKTIMFEKDLDDHLKRHLCSGRIRVYEKIPKIPEISVYIISVGTPLGINKQIELSALGKVCEQIRDVIKNGDLVILRSTVKVGTTRKFVKPIFEGTGVSFELAFCPERTVEGKALIELNSLPQVVSGLTDSACLRVAELFGFLTPTVVKVANVETAELVKLVNNTQRDVLFAFANEVAMMCEVLGVNVTEVVHAAVTHYPRGILPLPGLVGGPCLEKDPYILAESLKQYGYQPQLTLTARKWNEDLPMQTVKKIKTEFDMIIEQDLLAAPVISILGLAFKGNPETDDLRGTMAIPLIAALKESFPGSYIQGYDPIVDGKKISALGIKPIQTLEEAFSGSNIVIIQNNNPLFQKMPIHLLAKSMSKPSLIYDYWNLFSSSNELLQGIKYIALGNHQN